MFSTHRDKEAGPPKSRETEVGSRKSLPASELSLLAASEASSCRVVRSERWSGGP